MSTRPERPGVVQPLRRRPGAAGVAAERGVRLAEVVLHRKPRDRHVAAARAQRRAVHRAEIDLPLVGGDDRRRRPLAALEPRDADVAHPLGREVAKRGEHAVGGHRRRRLAALADAMVDLDIAVCFMFESNAA